MSFDHDVAARTVWMEARGEPLDGQAGVAHVLYNRLKDGRWGKTMTAVCLSPNQFSGWNTDDPNRAAMSQLTEDALATMLSMIQYAQVGFDPVKGATHYYNPKIITKPPAWVKGATLVGQFGNHLFFKDVK